MKIYFGQHKCQEQICQQEFFWQLKREGKLLNNWQLIHGLDVTCNYPQPSQVCFCLVSVGAANPGLAAGRVGGNPRIPGVTSEPARILKYVNERNEDGSYTYGFQVSWSVSKKF